MYKGLPTDQGGIEASHPEMVEFDVNFKETAIQLQMDIYQDKKQLSHYTAQLLSQRTNGLSGVPP